MVMVLEEGFLKLLLGCSKSGLICLSSLSIFWDSIPCRASHPAWRSVWGACTWAGGRTNRSAAERRWHGAREQCALPTVSEPFTATQHTHICMRAGTRSAVGGGVLRVGSTASAVWAREERAFCSLPSALKAAFNHLSTSAPLWLSNYRRCPLMKGLLGWVAARELTERAESQGSHIMNSLKWERDVNALASIVLSRCFGKPSVWCADNWRLYCQTRAISSSVGV